MFSMPQSYSKCLNVEKFLDLFLILKPIENDIGFFIVLRTTLYGYLRWHWIILFVIASEWLCLTKSEVNLDPPESGRRFC